MLVRLYTGPPGVPAGLNQTPDAEGARKLRDERFQNYALPYYVTLKPTGNGEYRKIASYEKGLINDTDEFARFLKDSLEAGK